MISMEVTEMSYYSVMIKPVSSSCNLQCTYCFSHDLEKHKNRKSSNRMTSAVEEQLIANIFGSLKEGDSLSIAFQGGEPTLAGLDFFRRFTGYASDANSGIRLFYSLQTNGSLLDDEWCVFLREHRFLVGLSLDGYAEHHNLYRSAANGVGNYDNMLAAKSLLDRYAIEYNILCTLTGTLAGNAKKVWNFMTEHHILHIQFTPCIGGLEGVQTDWMLTPRQFHDFYKSIFSFWKRTVKTGQPISVKLFDDIVNMFLFNRITSCGFDGRCQPQSIIDADGSMYPCDFYILDDHCVGNQCEMPYRELLRNSLTSSFMASRPPLPATCGHCRYRSACGGGCKRMFTAMYVDSSERYCGFRHLLDDILDELLSIAMVFIKRANATLKKEYYET